MKSPSQHNLGQPAPHQSEEAFDNDRLSCDDVTALSAAILGLSLLQTTQETSPADLSITADALGTDAWKSALGINKEKCGGTTENNIACKRNSPKYYRLTEDAIDSLRVIRNSPANTEAQLSRLALMSLCYQHKGHMDLRVDKWLSSLHEKGFDVNYSIVALKRKLCQAFHHPLTHCSGLRLPGVPCNDAVGGQKVHNSTRTFWALADLLRASACSSKVEYMIRVLQKNMLCKEHHNEPFVHQDQCEQALDGLRTVRPGETKYVIKDKTELSRPQEAINADVSEIGIGSAGGTSVATSISQGDFGDIASCWSEGFDESPLMLVKTITGIIPDAYLHRDLARLAEKELNDRRGSKNEIVDGYVYIYEVHGKEGYVNIGSTTKKVASRIREWEFDCNMQLNLLYPGELPHEIVPHARRVEALVHKELQCRNIHIYCHGCLRRHEEWFEIPLAEAINVVTKWSRWMAERPYEQTYRSLKWQLKRSESAKLCDMPMFLKNLHNAR
ncbi:hypothetical protein NQ176_g1388 [Zarea fungicola]|uniref:Uncharacterized protein n=1 Tax=Zarea fungicola TaxID=93591 RepID=A0ACC1NUA3_9HYPO|nr:hypothetical protein NQ176_g1388 [Lecanicillium fungicola]